MIDRYSFLNIEELTEQRGHIKKASETMRGEKRGVAGGRRRQRASRKGNETGGASGRKNRVKVSFN